MAEIGVDRLAHGGEDHVVDGAAEPVLDRLGSSEREVKEGDAPVGADGHVERSGRHRSQQGEQAAQSGGAAQLLGDCPGQRRRTAGDEAGATGQSAGTLPDHVPDQLGGAWHGRRTEGPLRRRGPPLGIGVEKDGREVDTGDAVEHGVVELAVERQPAPLQSLDPTQTPCASCLCRGRAWIRATYSSSSRVPPGAGRAARRRW